MAEKFLPDGAKDAKRRVEDDVESVRKLAISWEAAGEAVLILFLATLVAIGGGVAHCVEYSECSRLKTCANASRWRAAGLSCSFINYVDAQADVLYGSASNESYVSFTRSVCAPGERLHINSVSGRVECAPYRSWPDALNKEIMDSAGSNVHTQMCGKWIAAGNVLSDVEYWSFEDSSPANRAVRRAEAARYSSTRLSGTDLGKFYSSCSQAVLGGNGAIRASSLEAYEYLKSGLVDITTLQRVLEAAGWLAGHSCDGPVLVGTGTTGGSMRATMVRGSSFASGVLARSLYAVEEPLSLQSAAEAGNAGINSNAFSSPSAVMSELEYVFEGATGRTDHDAIVLYYAVTPELDGLVHISKNNKIGEASAYLHGVAAQCSFALHGGLNIESTGDVSVSSLAAHSNRPPAAALGRLKPPPIGEVLAELEESDVLNASAVSFSQLKAEPVGDAGADCISVARFLFPDRVDSEHFDLMISDRLYERLHEISEALRSAVADVVQNEASVSSVLTDAAAVADAVQTTRIRVAGAPRGTWGGIARDYPDGRLESADGPMLMALKQAQAMFEDRTSLLFDAAGACAAPAVYPAVTANAYIYPGDDCTHILLGVLRKPFADERYDNASLASRAGWIVAHELAHNTLVTPWDTTAISSLLSRYSSNLYSEALADVVAALAVIHSGLATGTQVCHHVSQLWCARTPMGFTHDPGASHPGPNQRGDALCSTLGDLGFM